MSSIEASRIEYINSANRSNGSNENFTWTVTMSQDEVYDKVCVLFANIPISYYLVSNGTNVFRLSETTGITITVDIIVPPGDYSAVSFINVVLPLINSASPHSWIYTMSLNNSFTSVQNGLYTWTVTGNAGGTASFIFPIGNYLFDQFGFANGSTNAFTANTLVSKNVLNFIPETTMYVYSNLIETKQNNTTNILQEFYGENNVNFSNLVYQCTTLDGYSKNINNGHRNSFTLTLLDEYGNLMNLNGRPWFITLLFYKSNDIFDTIKRFIKYTVMKT